MFLNIIYSNPQKRDDVILDRKMCTSLAVQEEVGLANGTWTWTTPGFLGKRIAANHQMPKCLRTISDEMIFNAHSRSKAG